MDYDSVIQEFNDLYDAGLDTREEDYPSFRASKDKSRQSQQNDPKY